MKIFTIIGARPQFIKAAALSRVLRKRKGVTEILVHTGQHFDANMSEVFFDELNIPHPDYNLEINQGSHGDMTGRMLGSIEQVLLDEKPDWVLVYGDTNSTLAGALAAVKLHIPVAHVEAGLRSFNRKMPEEINRVLTDHASDLLFTPTATAVENLSTEGISGKKVKLVGDIMYDTALYYGEKANQQFDNLKNQFELQARGFALATIHRAENTDDPQRLKQIIEGLIELNEDLPIIWPLHPRTRKQLKEVGLFEKAKDRLTLIEPIGYLDMVALEKHAALIVTDSGGVQKEAFFHQTPCLTLRDETEWVELVDKGFNQLVNIKNMSIKQMATDILKNNHAWNTPLYGNGDTAEKICDALLL